MPESKKRKKATPNGDQPRPAATPAASPRWWAPTMVTLMVLGLVSVVLTYLTKAACPSPASATGTSRSVSV
ncbi:cell division protein CrgA [Georgenia sp. SUBG003]|uniref:cell division protein CrgA n=1 Tax=Georgenia sp. SUBG003 TaxID=1497974 RepID=UPI003AB158AF